MKKLFKLNIIERYIIKEILHNLILSILAINMILMMEKLLRLTRLLSGIGTTISDFLHIILLIQPQLTILTLPMSLMTAVLFTYSRLHIDNELITLKIAGASFDEIIRPVLFLSTGCFIVAILISFYVSPVSAKNLRLKITNIISFKAPLAIKERTFHTLFRDMVIFVHQKVSNNLLQNVFIYDKRDNSRPWSIFSKSAQIVYYDDLSAGFILKNGEVFFAEEESITKLSFVSYNLKIRINPEINPKMSEFTPKEILEQAKTAPNDDKPSMYIEFHRRITFPLMALLVSILSPCLALISGQRGRLGGLSMGILFFIFYYSILTYSENLAKSGKISTLIGGWTPLFITLIMAIFLLKRQQKR